MTLAQLEDPAWFSMFQGEVIATSTRCSPTWTSGETELRRARALGHWDNGEPIGQGHPSPCLSPEYELQIAKGSKTIEGRPANGFAKKVQRNDWINFAVSQTGGRRLVCRVEGITCYSSFDAMLVDVGIERCLPSFTGSVAEAAALYRTFQSRMHSYADLEADGVVAIHVKFLGKYKD